MPDDNDPVTLRVPRARTQAGAVRNRDELSDAARAAHASSIPRYASEDITGQVMALTDEEIVADDPDTSDADDLSAEELAEVRSRRLHADRERRPTVQRVGHLERKMDKIVPDIAHIKGTLAVLPQLVRDAATAAREAAAAANAVASAHRIATVTATVETGGAAAVGAIQVNTAEKLEKVEKRKTWRELAVTAAKIAAGIAGAGGIADLIHRLGGG